MTKFTFNRLATLVNAPAAINGIITQIEAALDTLLSRDGASPNQMTANLDMNSNKILNLPTPITSTEPVRVQDLSTFIPSVTNVIWVWQVKRALQSLNYYYTIDTAIEVGPENATWITWTAGTTTYKGDSLYTKIKDTTSVLIADQVYDLAPGMLP